MMSIDELLGRLARLDARDRAWLLGELPPAMRRDLAVMLDEEPAPGQAASAATPASSWELLDTQRLANLFQGEAAWLVSAATRGTESRWRERLLQAMGARRRHEIELADRGGASLGPRAVNFVLESCRARLGSIGAAPAVEEARGGFASILDRVKGRRS